MALSMSVGGWLGWKAGTATQRAWIGWTVGIGATCIISFFFVWLGFEPHWGSSDD